MKQITIETLKGMFAREAHAAIDRLWAREDLTHLVVFENAQLDSYRLGERSALGIGPGFTYKTLDSVARYHLGDLPSCRQYPVSYATKLIQE